MFPVGLGSPLNVCTWWPRSAEMPTYMRAFGFDKLDLAYIAVTVTAPDPIEEAFRVGVPMGEAIRASLQEEAG